MGTSFIKAFQRLQHKKEAMLTDLSQWPEARLQYRPNETTWSAVNVMDHVIRVESAWQSNVKANLRRNQPVTFRNRLGALMVNSVMRVPLRVKVPGSASAVVPGPAASLPMLIEEWAKGRAEMEELLGTVAPSPSGVFKHPVGGWMAMPQAIEFLEVHLIHHGFQIKRLKRASQSLS